MKELDKTMYFRANRGTLETARLLRRRMTDCELLLWERLKAKKILGLRFRRQHPVDIFIADFYCHEARLVIEIDGDIHKEKFEYDEGREAEIEKYGIKFIRFTNNEILNEIDIVINKIKKVVNERISSPPWGI
ncbi:MAG: endonuclease domain-containing protein [Bacteroidales bacterium]|nr:endonuclease domain-containing protein [Bacteroidales bacterium]